MNYQQIRIALLVIIGLVSTRPSLAVYLTIDSYSCNGDLTLASLSLQCSRGDCDFGTNSIQLTGSVNIENEVSDEMYMTTAAYIKGLVSSTLYSDVIYPCNTLTTSEDFGYYCPEAGLYNFTITYVPPEYGSSVWWSSGQIQLSATFETKEGSESVCELVLSPSNVYQSTQSKSNSYSSTWSLSAASLGVLGAAAYFGKRRSCATRGDRLIEGDGEQVDGDFQMSGCTESCDDSTVTGASTFELTDGSGTMVSSDSTMDS